MEISQPAVATRVVWSHSLAYDLQTACPSFSGLRGSRLADFDGKHSQYKGRRPREKVGQAPNSILAKDNERNHAQSILPRFGCRSKKITILVLVPYIYLIVFLT